MQSIGPNGQMHPMRPIGSENSMRVMGPGGMPPHSMSGGMQMPGQHRMMYPGGQPAPMMSEPQPNQMPVQHLHPQQQHMQGIPPTFTPVSSCIFF